MGITVTTEKMDCYKRGKGIMAMRWRTYSDQFRDIKVVYPSFEEQQEIVN